LAAPENPSPETKIGFRPEVPPPPPEQQTGYRLDPSDLLKHRHADTARKLAYALVALMGITILLHYTSLTILLSLKRDEEAKTLERLFNALLPVIAGLASSAATYYFTREGK